MSTEHNSESGTGMESVSAVIVLAAGGGTRMKSATSKLLHTIAGRPMLSYAVNAAEELNPRHLVVVVGHQRDQVMAHLSEIAPQAEIAVQEQLNGTGGAVRAALEVLPADLTGEVVVTYGDVPLLRGDTLQTLIQSHRADRNAVTILTATVPDPTGYGRIIRSGGQVQAIVEHRDATDDQLAVREINSGIYVFDAELLRTGVAQLSANNAQGELYLTDVIRYAHQHGGRVSGVPTGDLWQTQGVNDRVQLSEVNAELNRRILRHWMLEGVTVVDPANTWVDADVDLAPDVTLLPGVQLQGATSVASGAVIGPDSTLKDVEVGEDATVTRTHAELSVIGAHAEVGPFARLRPGTELDQKGKIGTFVETKNAKIGPGAKVPHLTYCGDAQVDEGANIGAGTIFANYDGIDKWHTHVGRQGFVGSNSVLVAPVDVGDGAFVAAGSTITENVPPGALAVARGRQHVSKDWTARRKPGSKLDEAARSASGEIAPQVAADQERAAHGHNEERQQ